ncbi:NADH-ubiquinone oxidoreductase-F iron-sulfur binding region domain-containing protein [Actinophytocola sp.]|uniref:NADH-ubiquinone oxidoreductase-F iron-sulfur binding region domain-containing protein n=1 Tax=Actinophytocola sp. TaxID=1872138 RepID=UPI002ED5D0AE
MTTSIDTDLLGATPPGPMPSRGGDLIADLAAAGLTGRGGAGFPAWRKATTALSGCEAVVIANGAEGEPLSRKDATLLLRNPHLVLDGLALTAEAVNATRAYVYVPAGPGADTITAALAQRRDRVSVAVVHAPDRFVAGEESAVIAAVEGRDALPRFRTRPAAMSGVDGRPTVVHNVETLAHIAMIARNGPSWFRRTGTQDEPGTFLATVSGSVAMPGVYEAPVGIPLDDLLAMAGAAPSVRSVLVGGYHGVWVPAGPAPLSRAGLAPYGGSPGAGIVHALPAGRCPLRFAAETTRYLAEQSAGKCGPCLNGLPAIAATMTALAAGRAEARRLDWLTGLVTGRGACHHPDGTVRFVRSTLTTFTAEVDAHRHGHCTTGVIA